MHHTHTCCNDKEICSIHTYRSIDELTYKIKERLVQLSNMKIRSLFYGYHSEYKIDDETNKLTILKKSLDRIKVSFLHIQKSCLSDETIQKIVEKANKIISKSPCPKKRVDVQIGDENIKAYLMTGPRCVSYDTWNEFSRYICGKVGFQITAEKEICDITFEIARDIISCNLLYALSIRKEVCNFGYSVNRTDEECKTDWKILLEKNPDCELDFKTYTKFVKRDKLSFPIINEVYASGLALAEEDGQAVVCTPLNRYKLTEITPTSLEELLNLGFVVQLNREDVLIDYGR